MPQEVNPTGMIPSVRTEGYQVGDEITLYGKSMRVTGLRPDGNPILAPSPDQPRETPDPGVTAPKTSLKTSSGSPKTNLLERIYSRADKFRELPDEVRDKVLDALYMKAVDKHLPKSIDAAQREELKFRFKQNALGIPRQPLPPDPISEANYKKASLPTGAGGRFQSGVMTGLANVTEFAGKALPSFMGGVPEKYKDVYAKGVASERESGKVLSEASSAYAERHPTKASLSEIAGQALPGVPYGMVSGMGLPGGAGLGLASRLGLNALRGGAAGAVENTAFDPTAKGVVKGAGLGAASSVPFTLGGALLRKMAGGATKAIPGAGAAAGETISGAAPSATSDLEAIAQRKFQQPLAKLTAQQKVEATTEWLAETQKKAQAGREAAKAAAEAAKAGKEANRVTSKVKKAVDKVTTQVETRRAMDEAKALQKQIAAFIKANKRAPNDTELAELRIAKPAAEAAPTAVKPEEMPKMKAPVPVKPPTEAERADFRKIFLIPELKKKLAEATTPEEKEILSRQLQHAEMPMPQAFQVENPEVVKAVSAVADIKKIPEGMHGTGELGKRAKDAERVAKARELAKATQPEPAAPGTPESALLDKEEQFLQQMESLEALGEKGKLAAKNLNKFVRGGTLTMDQAMGMVEKVLAKLKKGQP